MPDLDEYKFDRQWLSERADDGGYPGRSPEPFTRNAERVLWLAENIYHLLIREFLDHE